MHKEIMGEAHKGHVIDHFNGCRHDNRRGNLRFASNTLNNHNKRSQPIKSNKYIGVHIRNTNICSWTAKFKARGLGTSRIQEHATWSYDVAIYQAYGKEANFNIIQKPESDSRSTRASSHYNESYITIC